MRRRSSSPLAQPVLLVASSKSRNRVTFYSGTGSSGKFRSIRFDRDGRGNYYEELVEDFVGSDSHTATRWNRTCRYARAQGRPRTAGKILGWNTGCSALRGGRRGTDFSHA